MIAKLGPGYHPDETLDQYINGKTREPSFTAAEIAHYQPLHDEACKVLGEEVYTIALEAS